MRNGVGVKRPVWKSGGITGQLNVNSSLLDWKIQNPKVMRCKDAFWPTLY